MPTAVLDVVARQLHPAAGALRIVERQDAIALLERLSQLAE